MNASDKIKNTFKIVHMISLVYAIKNELLHKKDIMVKDTMSFYKNWKWVLWDGKHSFLVDIGIMT